ncbi:hypothetical protein GFS31_37540 [Leptolyngbya sp. BL0902]|uniref:DUF29 domain-containing protein n=1 Tax=Leptolyngbya sp. BL0902 TaxID=1115757 RepID=UPI0018E7FB25|nr:DUF29 domain-containing protein [Leptolyngbya sp. BL0902]QQE67047.1 hypothetical protein GFS31_37540 [Leptolyngbya sp. BL0902]
MPLEQTSSKLSDLYRQDYILWLEKTCQKLAEKRFEDLDLPNLLEELSDMGRSEKRALISNVIVVLMHLLKYAYQPQKRSNSWRFTLKEHRRRIHESLKESPSLRAYLLQNFDECYCEARDLAATETGLDASVFPESSPFSTEQTLDRDFLPA